MNHSFRRGASAVILVCGVLAEEGRVSSAAVAAKTAAPPEAVYTGRIMPLLDRYCFACHGRGKHKGDVTLDGWKDEAAAVKDRRTWERVLEKLEAKEMPPEDHRQPSARERQRVVSWIEADVLSCDCEHPDPGRVTVRRLNRAEYNNTLRDLIGVDFRPADDFPVDDSGYGFDTIGDALSMPPVLLEKYLGAAQRVLDLALGGSAALVAVTNHYAVNGLEIGYNAKQRGDGWVALNSTEEDDVAVTQDAPLGGEFLVRVKAYARQDGTNAMRLTFMEGLQPVRMVEVATNGTAPRDYEARFRVAPGRHRFRAVVRRLKDGLPEAEALRWKKGPQQKGAVIIESMEVIGPLGEPGAAAPAEATRRLQLPPAVPGREDEAAGEFLRGFAARAYRRAVSEAEVRRLVELAGAARRRCAGLTNEPGLTGGRRCFEAGLRVALEAILVSPHFLFRGELQPEPDNPRAAHPIDEYALASRLSYFLWSSMPDEELFRLAERGRLRRNLPAQVRRMLREPKAGALVEHFAGQWLQLRNLELAAPDEKMFPLFNDRLRASMRRETELFFDHILREDRSVLEFLTADYTFVNPLLARLYGLDASNLAAAAGPDDFQRVNLRGTARRGVLTQASILLITSNPTRTSPVKRGKWVLDNLLGAPPPPPPPNVPELKEGQELKGTLRERMEQHRADSLCASCHARLDPIGFGLENFDGIGQWRTQDGGSAIDPTGRLSTGEMFRGPDDLTRLLAQTKQEQFVRCFAEKLLTYALGRGLDPCDRCAIDAICRSAGRRGYRMSAFMAEVVKSAPFQLRRGDGAAR